MVNPTSVNDSSMVVVINRADVEWAVDQGVVSFASGETVDTLWQRWQARTQQREHPRWPQYQGFSSFTVAYGVGTAFISLGMLWILFLAWSRHWGGGVVFSIAAFYACVLIFTANRIYNKYPLAAGWLVTATVTTMVPTAVYGLQYMCGLWYNPDDTVPPYYENVDTKILWNFLPMELAVLVSSFIAMAVYKFPFLTVVPLLLVWFMIYSWTDTYSSYPGGEPALWASSIYGLLVLILAHFIETHMQQDSDPPRDWTSRMFVIGGLALWLGLMGHSFWYDSEVGSAFNVLINVGFIVLSVVWKGRRIFLATGLIGVLVYVIHLNDILGQYVLFPVALTLAGGCLMAWGVQRNRLSNDGMTRGLLEDNDDSDEDLPTNNVATEEEPAARSSPDVTSGAAD